VQTTKSRKAQELLLKQVKL